MGSQRAPHHRLTPLETLIMNALWDDYPAPVRQVQERLAEVKPMAYSTVLTTMRILRNKGFLTSQRQGKADYYSPVVSRRDAGKRSLGEVLDSYFSGSAEVLVSQLLNGESLSAEELVSIRAEVDRALSRHGRQEP